MVVDSLIDINNIITGLNNINLRKFNVKTWGFYKTYIDKDLIEDKLYLLINQLNKRKLIREIIIMHY